MDELGATMVNLVVGLAAASYAHFGVHLKDPPCARQHHAQVVHRVGPKPSLSSATYVRTRPDTGNRTGADIPA